MKRAHHPARARERKLNQALMAAFVIVLVAGTLWQVLQLVGLSRQGREIAALRRETYALSVRADNLDLSISQYHNLERIAARAQQLGMEQPDQSRLRVVNLPPLSQDASPQSADSHTAAELLD
ncbi:MAG: hypothetical protein IJH38_01205 [Clostridia bacterium]|nr:hypothetical protein [Clostridia bacterium]